MNVKNILYFSLGPIGASVLSFITLPIVAWFFSAEDIGRLSMLQVACSFSVLFFSLGLDQAYVREYHESDYKPTLLISTILPGLLLLIVSTVIIGFSSLSAAVILFDVESKLLSALLLCSIFFVFISRFLSLILRMQERGLAYSVSQLLPKILFLIIIGTYVIANIKSVFINLVLANFASLASVFFLLTWTTKRQWFSCFNAKIDTVKLWKMIKYSVPLVGGGVAFWGLTATDKIFLRQLSTFEELGVYSVAISFAGAALVFQTIFSTIWAPSVYKWGDNEGAVEKIKKVTDYVSLAVLVIWCLSGMFSWILAYILPAAYVSIPNIMLATMAYPLLYMLSEATGVGIGLLRKTMYSMLAAISALSVNVLGNYFLIPNYGAAGAAMASAIAFFVFFTIRTEASAMLWVNFERAKMYCLVFLLMLMSLLMNFIFLNKFVVISIYTCCLLFSLFSYAGQVRHLYHSALVFSKARVRS